MVKKRPKKRASIPRPYNWGTMSESEIRNKITAKLRMLTRRWVPKQQCIRNSWWICAECWWKFLKKELEADHIREVVPIQGWKNKEDVVFWYNWNEWISRAFVEDWWRALCKTCHKKITKLQNEERKKYKQWKTTKK